MDASPPLTPGSVSVFADPQTLWPSEVDDFAPWLIENLGRLGELLGMRLSFIAREVPIGRLRADIVARDEAGRRVIIEAQFGPSDHQHLGQIVTYACAGQADVIIWVVTSGLRGGVRAEHVTTLAKLNERFAGETAFHAVAVSYTSDQRPWGSVNVKPWPLSPRMRLVSS